MQNLNPSLTLITLALLILHITAFHLFLNHGCYLQNIFYANVCIMYYAICLFQFSKPFQDVVYLFQTMET